MNRNYDRSKKEYRPDRIYSFVNREEEAVPLMEFIQQVRPDAKRGDIKKWMK